MADFERFRLLLEEERARKLALLPALRADISSAAAARQDSNVDDEHDPEGATIAFELSQASALLNQSTSGLAEVEAALQFLIDKYPPLVARLARSPGAKEVRYAHLLCGEPAGVESAAAPQETAASPRQDRVRALEEEVAALKAEVARLSQEFAEIRRLLD